MITTTLRKLSEYTARGISPKYVETNGLMVLNQKCIRNQKIDFSPARLTDVNKKFAPSKKIKLHDILINSTGVGTLGRVAQVSKELNATVDSHITIFRSLDYSKELDIKICKKYIGYALREKEKEIEALGKGATGQTELSKDSVLDNIEIRIPKEFEKQNEIASVLAVYDDLMENNEKRIKILEEMAQLIYTEWFVKFKFPGHENVNLVDSGTEFGMIPEGWEVKSFVDFFNIKYGKNLPTTKISSEGRYKVYGAGGVIGYYEQKNIDQKTALVTCRGNGSGTVWRTFGEGFVTNNSFTVDCNLFNGAFEFVFNCLKQCNIASAISGSAQPQITIESINFVKFVLPANDLIDEFINKTSEIYILADILRSKNKNLSQIRDLLIPQLVTGKRELK